MNDFDLNKIFEIVDSYRKKILFFISIFFLFFIITFIFSEKLLEFICIPFFALNKKLPDFFLLPKNLIYTAPFEIIWVKLKISIVFCLIILWPLIIFIIIKEINKIKEIKHIYLIIFILIFLFYSGISFSFYFIIPIILNFFLNFESSYLQALWTITNYTNLVINISVLTGMFSEFPIILIGLVWINLIEISSLLNARKYIIVLIFIIAAAATPGPDVVSQLLVAIPIWIIFEITLLFLKIFYR